MHNNLREALALVLKELEQDMATITSYDCKISQVPGELAYELRRVQQASAYLSRLVGVARQLEKLANQS